MRLTIIPQPVTEGQVLALYGGIIGILQDILGTYAEELGPYRLCQLADLKAHLIASIKNQNMSGLPMEEQPRVVEILLGLLDAGCPGVEIDGQRII